MPIKVFFFLDAGSDELAKYPNIFSKYIRSKYSIISRVQRQDIKNLNKSVIYIILTVPVNEDIFNVIAKDICAYFSKELKIFYKNRDGSGYDLSYNTTKKYEFVEDDD